jgi:2-methylcitrate dehydratase PrpD
VNAQAAQASTTSALTTSLAEFAATTCWADVPEPARRATRRTIANAVGLAVGASGHPVVELATATLVDLGLTGRHRLLGRYERLSAPSAALVNGIAVHVEDFDDTHLRTVVHPAAPIVPAALAAAELTGASGAELALSVLLGVEVACRVGNAVCPEHFDRGWHLTSTMGRLGAAVAAGRLLGLDAHQLASALAVTAAQVGGLTSALGTMTKAFHPGKAAADGIEAAVLADCGLTGPARPIEGQNGLAAVSSSRRDYAEALRDLAAVWEIESNTFKPYSCGIVSHPVIDAAIETRRRLGGGYPPIDARVIDSVVVTVNPVVLDVMGVAEPADGLQSKFSVYHCFAVGLLAGAAGPAQYSDTRAVDPEVVSLRRKVRAVTDPGMRTDECRATVRTAGVELAIHVPHATGSVHRPMTDEQLRSKFGLVTEPVLGESWQRLWDSCATVDSLDSVTPLFELARAVR